MPKKVIDRGELGCTVGECSIGEWVRLDSGWWRLGAPIAGGVGARPRIDSSGWAEDLDQRWPEVLPVTRSVLERHRVEVETAA